MQYYKITIQIIHPTTNKSQSYGPHLFGGEIHHMDGF